MKCATDAGGNGQCHFCSGWRLEPVLTCLHLYIITFLPPRARAIHLELGLLLSHGILEKEVLPIFLKIGGDFTHPSAQMVSNFILSSLIVFMLRFMLYT
jgi:hypothetical protein